MLVEDTHKVKVSILRYLPVVWEDVLGLDVVAGLVLRLVVVVVLLLLGCLVRVLLVEIVHEGWTYWLLGGGVPCGGRRVSLLKYYCFTPPITTLSKISRLTPHGSLVFLLLFIIAVDDHSAQV